MSKTLPKAFADLEPYRAKWALATERQRHTARLTTPIDESRDFYEAVLARMEDIVEHLDTLPLNDMPQPEQDLLYLALSFMEVSLAVEQHGQSSVPFGFEPSRFGVTF